MAQYQGGYSLVNGELILNSPEGSVAIQSFFENGYEKPTYIYNLDDIEKRVEAYQKAFRNKIHIHFSVKSNDHPVLLKFLGKLGLGMDVVSGGEVIKALEAEVSPSNIVFSGVGKTKREIALAIEEGIGQINIESPAEFERIGAIAKEMNKSIEVAFRLNPDVNPRTHPYIQTGFRENKFGMDHSFLSELDSLASKYSGYVSVVGVTAHIGSQLRELTASLEAAEKVLETYDHLISKGYPLKTFDIGGGLGINYQSLDVNSEFEMMSEYGAQLLKLVGDRKLDLLSEPGRILVGRSGVLVGEVQYIKETPYKNFAIVDTGMHHLMRPCLYQAHHEIYRLNEKGSSSKKVYDIVGPICESSDVLGFDRSLSELKEGDLLGVMDAGAYGRVMASHYNSHEMPNEIFIKDLKVWSE